MRRPSAQRIRVFREKVLAFYAQQGRTFPWRSTRSPYRIWVSEVMLQQTQTERVRIKYQEFLKLFPTVHALGAAAPSEVIRAWSGLGYNRRALHLHRAAQIVCSEYQGKLPRDPDTLRALPGIGRYTARAISCFAWNHPSVFIETNIRTVFIHEFFDEQESVDDKELEPLIEASIDAEDPRRWYYALMDYGVHLKKQHPGIGQRSKHYVRQSPFKGSQRQLRGKVLRVLASQESLTLPTLVSLTGDFRGKVVATVEALIKEGFIQKVGTVLRLRS